MQFSSLPTSAHELIVLRPIVSDDLATWHAYLTMPAVFEHTSWNVQSVAELSPHVWGPESFTAATSLRFAVALRTNNRLVGTVGFHTVSPLNRSAEIAYDFAPEVWGQGIASYVCDLLTTWAHSDAGLIRVQATVLESNVRSARVLDRCAFDREGLLRSFRMVRGQPGNFFMYSHIAPLPVNLL